MTDYLKHVEEQHPEAFSVYETLIKHPDILAVDHPGPGASGSFIKFFVYETLIRHRDHYPEVVFFMVYV